MKLDDHPTVKKHRAMSASVSEVTSGQKLETQWLKELAVEAGADDAGLVEITRASLAQHKEDILNVFPATKTMLSIVCRLNPENIRCASRAVSDLEFLQMFDKVNDAARLVARKLRNKGVRSLSTSAGFPMDMAQWPGKMWAVSHKPIAVEAGLGQLGLNRLLLHPRFGNFVVLGTILLEREVTACDQPIDYNPCLDCKLCAAVCPVGAIGEDGHFQFSNCMTHNYRDRMGGFSDWVENIACSKNHLDYRKRVSDPETVSMWQSLSYGICNKSSYCMAVCPAGEEMIGPFLENRKKYLADVVKPLQEKKETIFTVPKSDAEDHVANRYPHKIIKHVSNGLRPKSASSFLESLPLVFQRGKSKDLNATYHFTFTGAEQLKATVEIRDAIVKAANGHAGSPDLSIRADARTWVGFLAKEKNIMWAMATGKIKVKGSPRLLKAFARCFPG